MTRPDQDPVQWLRAARAGSREALGEVLEACRRYLLRVAREELDPALQPKGGTSDLVQQTFLEAQRDFAQFHGDTEEELLAWMRRVLLHNIADFTHRYRDTDKRQASREVPLDAGRSSGDGGERLFTETPSPSSHAIGHEQALALERALDRMPDDYRRVLTLRNREDRSFEEIGRLMERSPEAARKLWTRAVDQLRKEWDAHHEP